MMLCGETMGLQVCMLLWGLPLPWILQGAAFT